MSTGITDESFFDFASKPDHLRDERFSSWESRDELISLCKGNVIVAKAVFSKFDYASLIFMGRPLPSLDNQSPMQIMKSENGKKLLIHWLIAER